jgi:hypothetical protein
MTNGERKRCGKDRTADVSRITPQTREMASNWNGDGSDDFTGLLIVCVDFDGDGFDDNDNGGGNSFGDSFPFDGGEDMATITETTSAT